MQCDNIVFTELGVTEQELHHGLQGRMEQNRL
jgi:hypothetical protein